MSEHEHDPQRRDTLKILGAIGSTCAYPFSANELYGQQEPVTPPQQTHQHAGPPERPPAVPTRAKPGFFTDDEFTVVTRVADLILPATDTPGAVGAGVPAYIDAVVGGNKELQSIVRPGLQKLLGRGFATLSEAEQISVLTPLAEGNDAFFRAMKNLTADGYYTSHVGLVEELGYKGNTVMEHFPESRIAEH